MWDKCHVNCSNASNWRTPGSCCLKRRWQMVNKQRQLGPPSNVVNFPHHWGTSQNKFFVEMLIVMNLDCFHHSQANYCIAYPQSKYAVEKERPILHQCCGGRPGQVGCTYITFEWKHIKEVLCVLGQIKPPRCHQFIKNFCDCFIDNINSIGCCTHCATAIPMQGQWCGIRVYDPWAFCTKHYDITQNLN